MRGAKQHLGWLVALLLLVVAGWLGAHVDPNAYAGGRARDEQERLRRNSSALAAMLGEFRTSLSDIMFIKTERYLHGGVAYLPHMGDLAMSAEELIDEVDEHQSEIGLEFLDHDEEGDVPTIIPTPERDFRGWVGNLHREVQPWRDPTKAHIHTDGRDLIPWFRLMTRADSHYIRGYTAGGFWLNMADPEAALAFIEEGIQHNPQEFQLYVSRGFLLIREARRTGVTTSDVELEPEVAAILERARDDFRKAAQLALVKRPDDVDEEGFGSGGWGSYHENDALAASRMDILLTRRLGDPDLANQLAHRYANTFPEMLEMLQ